MVPNKAGSCTTENCKHDHSITTPKLSKTEHQIMSQ